MITGLPIALLFLLNFSEATYNLGVLETDANKTQLCKNGLLEASNDQNCVSDDIVIQYQSSCTGSDETAKGTSNSIELEFVLQVNAFVGPLCEDDSIEIGRMAYFWKRPFFSRSVQSKFMFDKEAFPNTVRTTSASAAGLIRSVYELYNNINGTAEIENITLIGPASRGEDHYPLAQAIMDYLEFDPLFVVSVFGVYDEKESIPPSLKQEIERIGSKLIVVATDFEYSEFISLLQITDWYNNGFIVVLLSPDPLFGQGGSPGAKKDIANSHAIVIAPAIDSTLVGSIGQWDQDGVLSSFSSRLSLFLSCYAYCYSTKRGVTGDTQDFYNIFRNQQISSNKFGSFRFDGGGDFLQDFVVVRLKTDGGAFETIATINTTSRSSCDGVKCFDTTFNVVTSDSSILQDLKNKKKSLCTFTNSCDAGFWGKYGIYLGIALVIILTGGSIIIYVIHKRKSIDRYRLHWKVKRDEVKIIENKQSKGAQNKNDLSGKRRNVPTYALVGTYKSEYMKFLQVTKINWTKAELKYLYELRLLSHDNVNRFVGLVCNERDGGHTGSAEFLVLSNMIERASLEDFISDSEFNLDVTFKSSFMRDIIKGLTFLHKSAVGYHGLLTASNCLVDAYWVLKLTNFGVTNMIHEFINSSSLRVPDPVPYQFYLPFAPESLAEIEITKNYPKGTPQADIFSLGYLMYQILYRNTPYDHLGVVAKLDSIQKIANYSWTPSIQDQEENDPALLTVIENCWHKTPDSRPKLKDLRKVVETTYSSAKGQLVDQMLDLNEKYASNLEKIVADRNSLLQDAQEQTLRLLNEMLPQSVAAVLMDGGNVEPRYYDEATVLFVQLCEFPQILKCSNPDQVIFFLNDIFELFDQVISRHDAYKVETTGETYMVVSGVPNENSGKHITEIADISLEIREVSWTYKIEHLSDFKVRCKIGFHCGPIATGVIGNVAPRFCLFGDTVNFASRMQSNCPPNQIQTSEVSAEKLQERSDEYKLVQRGIVQVKGKGAVNCYWLNEHVHLDEPPPGTAHGRKSVAQLSSLPLHPAEQLTSIAEHT